MVFVGVLGNVLGNVCGGPRNPDGVPGGLVEDHRSFHKLGERSHGLGTGLESHKDQV